MSSGASDDSGDGASSFKQSQVEMKMRGRVLVEHSSEVRQLGGGELDHNTNLRQQTVYHDD